MTEVECFGSNDGWPAAPLRIMSGVESLADGARISVARERDGRDAWTKVGQRVSIALGRGTARRFMRWLPRHGSSHDGDRMAKDDEGRMAIDFDRQNCQAGGAFEPPEVGAQNGHRRPAAGAEGPTVLVMHPTLCIVVLAGSGIWAALIAGLASLFS